jgi:NAD(P)H dehydrogenase (quinone)
MLKGVQPTIERKRPMYVIAGVTGNTGSVVATTLLSQGKPVRVIVRDAARGEPWRARGAEVAIASLEDPAALTAALRGAAGAYLLVPPRPASTRPLEENTALIASLARAVTDAKVPHVVLLSSIGAQLTAGTGPIVTVHIAERELGRTGAAVTAVRAAYFLENWGGALGALGQGILPTFLPSSVPAPMVATADIGRTAARALVEGGNGRQVIELAGPREYSPDDIAAAVSTITGAQIRAQQAPLDAVVPTFASFGVSTPFAELFRELYAAAAAGKLAWEGGHRSVRGTVTAEEVLRGLLRR